MFPDARQGESRRRWLLALILLVCVVMLETCARRVRPVTNTDTPSVMAMVAKDLNPSLYAPDSVFSTRTLYKNYLPVYRWVVGVFVRAAGSAWGGMLGLFPVTLLLVLAGLWLCFREVAPSVWFCLPLVLAASFVRDSGGGAYWGMTFESEPIARYVFLGPTLLAFVPLLRSWPNVSGRTAIFSLAALGVLANIHPPSVCGWFAAVCVLVLVSAAPMKRKLVWIGGGVLFALMVSLPTLVPTLHLTQLPAATVGSTPAAEVVRDVVANYEEVFPWVMRPLRDDLGVPGRETLWVWLVGYIALMALWAARYGLRRGDVRASRRSWLGLLLIQLPFAFVLSRLRAVDLCLVVLVYAWAVRREDTVSRLEWLGAALLASVVGTTWLGSAGLRLVWEWGEFLRLTNLTIMFSRAGRLVYLPLWLLAALWVKKRASRQMALPMILSFCAFLYPWRGQVAFLALTAGGVLGTEWYSRQAPHLLRRSLLDACLIALLAFGVLSYGDGRTPWGFRIVLSGAVLTASLGVLWLRRMPGTRARLAAAACGVVAVVILAQAVGRFRPEVRRAREYLLDTFTIRGKHAAQRDLFGWARAATPEDALFYVSDKDQFALLFRAFSERSIAFTAKVGEYNQPKAPVPEEYAKRHWEYFQLPYRRRDPVLLMELARRTGSDYAVVPFAFPLCPGERTVYRNTHYRVLSIPRVLSVPRATGNR